MENEIKKIDYNQPIVGVSEYKQVKELRWQKDNDGTLWFVAKDVCEMLALTNVTEALRNLDEDEKKLTSVKLRADNGVEQNREMNIVSESGMYALIMRSNKEEAKKFRKWVTSEVLPSIRKTGRYMKVVDYGNTIMEEVKNIRAWMKANLLKGDSFRIAQECGIGSERLAGWIRGKRGMKSDEILAVIGWFKKRNAVLTFPIEEEKV